MRVGSFPPVPGLILLVASSGLGACAPAAESPDFTEISDSAGLLIVQNRGSLWADGEGWRIASEPALTVGVVEGPEEYQLVEVTDAARRSDGSLVVADRGTRTVRIYGPRGQYLQTLGGPGSGPGDFANPGPILVIGGDTVVVWDQGLLRETRFSPRGDMAEVQTVEWGKLAGGLGSVRAERGKANLSGGKVENRVEGLYPGAMEPLADGSYLVRLVEKAPTPPQGERFRPRAGALLVSRDLETLDTLLFFGGTEQVAVDAPWGPLQMVAPLARETRIAHRGNPPMICIGDQESPEVRCLGSEIEATSIRWGGGHHRVTMADMEAWREVMLQSLAQKLGGDQIREVLAQVPVPEDGPPYRGIHLDPTGHLWVEVGRGVEGGGSGGSWIPGNPEGNTFGRLRALVFDPRGILLGPVELPDIRVLEIGSDYILGLGTDELGIQVLQLHELRKPEA